MAALIAAMFVAAGIISPNSARAALITVSTPDDELDVYPNEDGDCSLREALKAANTNSPVDACPAGSGIETDVISVPGGDYELIIAGRGENQGDQGDLDILEDVSIVGAGESLTTVRAGDPSEVSICATFGGPQAQGGPSEPNGIDRVFHVVGGGQSPPTSFSAQGVTAVAVEISGLTISNGAADDGLGGGVLNESGDLSITASTIEKNIAVAFSGPIAFGGGLASDGGGRVTLDSVEVLDNESAAEFESLGGGVASGYDNVQVDQATSAQALDDEGFSRWDLMRASSSDSSSDTAARAQGEIGSLLQVSDSHFEGNVTCSGGGASGGGLWAWSDADIDDSSFSANSAVANLASGGGIDLGPGILSVVGPTGAEGVSAQGGPIPSTLHNVDVYDNDAVALPTNPKGPFGGILLGVGGGLNVGGAASVTASTFETNQAVIVPDGETDGLAGGGGIAGGPGAELDIEESTLLANEALVSALTTVAQGEGGLQSEGGGLLSGGETDVVNSTFSGNSATAGGGLSHSSFSPGKGPGPTLDLRFSTVTDNDASTGGGIHSFADSTGGGVRLKGTIVALQESGSDCFDDSEGISLTSLGHNLDSDDTCELNGTGDLPKTNPMLDALAFHGLTAAHDEQTHALQSDSPAIDAVGSGACPPPGKDENGVDRPQNGDGAGNAFCDIGAFEVPEEVVDPELCPGFKDDSRNHVIGTPGPDNLDGTEGDDVICGLGSGDNLSGLSGDDLILGGLGPDTLKGGADDDTLIGFKGADDLQGGTGRDTVRGGNESDVMSGGAARDDLIGGDGDNDMSGDAGDDELRGGRDEDSMDGGDGDDQLRGFEGKDLLEGMTDDDRLHGGADNDDMKGGPGNDDMIGWTGRDTMQGQDDDDDMFGSEQSDIMDGGPGHDKVRGATGDDVLTGRGGLDYLVGYQGDDSLDGGPNKDECYPGGGSNFVVSCELP